MDLLNIITDKSFDEVKDILNKEPYYIQVKESTKYSNLYMLVYNNEISDFTNSTVRCCRGIILEKDTNKIISYTFNKKSDISVDDASKIYESIDGSHIKLYYYGGHWIKSTTRYIDAYTAYWHSSKSFGELFDECDSNQINYDTLNKDYCYGFVICHSENRIVTKYDNNRLVHVCTRDMSDINMPFVEVDVGVDKPRELQKEELEGFEINNKDKEGIFIWNDGCHNKIKFESYDLIKNLRINTNQPLFEYVTNLCNGSIVRYTTTYRERAAEFKQYENKIDNIVTQLHRSYMGYHVTKNKLLNQINKVYWKHMYSLHGTYKNIGTVITNDVVHDYIEDLDAPQVMHILNVI
jgi:hypothetical protein